MHNQPYVGRIALCKRKKLLKSGEIRHFYGIPIALQTYEGCPTWLVANRAHNYVTPLKTHIDINTHN